MEQPKVSVIRDDASIPGRGGTLPAGVHVSALYYYPIKACRGIRVQSLEIAATGPLHDRELLVIDAETRMFLTQRELPIMALIEPRLESGCIRLSAPGSAPFESELREEGDGVLVTIWRDQVESIDQGDAVAGWFSALLERNVRLVRKSRSAIRRVDPAYATGPEDQVAFADGYPLLVLSDQSLTALNDRLDTPLPMDRFRPNIVLGGCPEPHYEDGLGQFTIGELTLSAVKPCARCTVTTVDQRTAQVAKEPLRTLANYRRAANGGVTFGMNVIPHRTGRIAVGDGLVALNAAGV